MNRFPTDAPSLGQLIIRARAGDERALSEVFQQCHGYVAVLARANLESWLRAKVDASDLAQQTMLEAYRAFREFRGQTSGEWLAWLRAILRHNAAEYVRHYHGAAKRNAGREVPIVAGGSERFGVFEPCDSKATPSAVAVQREEALRLADAISSLPPDYQDVIMLRHGQRLPFDEIARRMSRSRPAVQMLWLRAVRKLQASLIE
jgi:RNA polymerase sigma-70 factor (ECF subfamily)